MGTQIIDNSNGSFLRQKIIIKEVAKWMALV